MIKTKVIKRNGKTVEFDWTKISNAIKKAFKSANIEDTKNLCFKIAARVSEEIDLEKKSGHISINEIQNKVEKAMIEACGNDGFPYEVAKKYILYRDRRDKDRESINKLAETFRNVINIVDDNTKKSNANIDGNTPAGQMMIFGAESSKDYACTHIVDPKYVKAHKDGFLHIHDLDYYSTKAANCNQIDLVELFSHEYIHTNDSIMRKPKRISSFAALAAIVLQSEQNEMFGGQAIHSWDYAMAKGVDLTFKEHFREYLNLYEEQNPSILKYNYSDNHIKIGSEVLKENHPWAYKKALKKTIRDTHEAMAGFIYNVNSMHSRGGKNN